MADILAIAAHPDDIELNCAGTLLAMADAGRSVAVCDLTAGERGSRGSRELRAEETRRANQALGITDEQRMNLAIPDGNIEVNKENVLKVVRAIRYFRPEIILFPWAHDRHPDHEHTNRLVREACFDSGLVHVQSEWNGAPQTPHRPKRMYMFYHSFDEHPDFVVDISDQFQRKLQAIAAYSSQFTIPGISLPFETDSPHTFISNPEFIEFIIGRMRHWGFMIGARYGEAYATLGMPLKVGDLFDTI